jgi:CysZ protein
LSAPDARRGLPPSLLDGALALFAGLRFIAQTPRAWPAAVVPVLIAAVLSGILVWFSFGWAGPWLSEALLPEAESWYARGAKSAIRWIGSAVAAYVSVLLALAATPPLSAPALEHLIRLQESALGVPARPARGLWFELRAELEAQLLAFALVAPPALLLWLLGVLAPPILPVVAPLQAVLVCFAVAWNLLGYPLSLRGVRARSQVVLLKSHAFAVLGFGGAFALISLVPGMALLLLPAGVVGATRLTHRMEPAHTSSPAQADGPSA